MTVTGPTPRIFANPREFLSSVGDELGHSRWRLVSQDMINQFADVTDDHQWIHVDPERASAGPYGTTIAHGFLTLSLIPSFLPDLYDVGDTSMRINYGLDRVRFITPVKAGARLRASARIIDAREADGRVRVTMTVTVQEEGAVKPACSADLVVLMLC